VGIRRVSLSSLAQGAPSGGLYVPSSAATGQEAATEPPPPSPTIALESLMAINDTLSPSELQRFEALLDTHLRALRPPQTSFSFPNGVNRRYELVSTRNRTSVVRTRQMLRPSGAVAQAAVNATHSDTPTCLRAIADM